jgi:hypothetical protein
LAETGALVIVVAVGRRKGKIDGFALGAVPTDVFVQTAPIGDGIFVAVEFAFDDNDDMPMAAAERARSHAAVRVMTGLHSGLRSLGIGPRRTDSQLAPAFMPANPSDAGCKSG